MSGHSKWAQIKYKKGAVDAKRGRLFSQLSRIITLAAKHGGRDPDMNAALRVAIEKAKQANMPSSNIDRAIARAGEKDASTLEEVRYEAYGPGGAALIIEGITDNSNRTSNELKHVLQKHGGKFAEPGAVSWMFEKKAVFAVHAPEKRDALELTLIDAGAEDIKTENNTLRVVAPQEKGERVSKTLAEAGISAEQSVEWVSRATVSLDQRQRSDLAAMHKELGEREDVQHIYMNVDM